MRKRDKLNLNSQKKYVKPVNLEGTVHRDKQVSDVWSHMTMYKWTELNKSQGHTLNIN